MEFRRSGHRDERRRRVLIDEPDVPQPTVSVGASQRRSELDLPSPGLTRPYTDAALAPHQARVTDLIPTRRWTNLVLFTLILSCAAGIEALYGHLALGHTSFDVSQFPAIDLSVRGNVATWFSSAILATCAVFGLLTYQIRRHRTDDYRGRYRMWCWVVPLFLLASIDQVAGIQESVRTALLHAANIPEYADAMFIWVASVALITGAIGGRLVIEMRACRLASLLLVISLACVAAVGAAQVGWLLTDASVFRTMVISGSTMTSHIALLMAIFLYARHVHRDASGSVPPKRVRKRKAKTRCSEGEVARTDDTVAAEPSRAKVSRRNAGKVIRTDPPHASSSKSSSDSKNRAAGSSKISDRPTRKEKRRVAADASTASTPSASSLCEPDDDQIDETRKLSKAERKRLRKQRRRER